MVILCTSAYEKKESPSHSMRKKRISLPLNEKKTNLLSTSKGKNPSPHPYVKKNKSVSLRAKKFRLPHRQRTL